MNHRTSGKCDSFGDSARRATASSRTDITRYIEASLDLEQLRGLRTVGRRLEGLTIKIVIDAVGALRRLHNLGVLEASLSLRFREMCLSALRRDRNVHPAVVIQIGKRHLLDRSLFYIG